MTTGAYVAKRAIVDHLTTIAGAGGPLAGVDVQYAYSGQMPDACLYAGGVTFDQTGPGTVTAGTDVLVAEVVTIGLYIRLLDRTGGGVRALEARAEQIGQTLGDELQKFATMAGPQSYTDIAGGTGDYQLTDDGPVVILAYRVTTTAYL